MATIGTITMSMREIDRIKTIQAIIDGNLKPGMAAQRLELTPRQAQRLVLLYCADGPAGLISRQRGRPSNHQLLADLADTAMRILLH